MSNTMYLVCVHHPEQVLSLRLGVREMDGYNHSPRSSVIEAFFNAHKLCGGGLDHFTIAYEQTKDHDLPIPAPVANAVHGVLRVANDCNAMPMDAGNVT
jgi:hypothetical protein